MKPNDVSWNFSILKNIQFSDDDELLSFETDNFRTVVYDKKGNFVKEIYSECY